MTQLIIRDMLVSTKTVLFKKLKGKMLNFVAIIGDYLTCSVESVYFYYEGRKMYTYLHSAG